MKKNSVRFLALFLAVCLIFSLGAFVFADDEVGDVSPAEADEPQDITEEVDVAIEDSGITVTVGITEVTPDEPYPDAENPSVTVTESDTEPDTVSITADIINEDGTGLTVVSETGGQVQVDAEDITAGDTGVIASVSSGAEAEITTGDITVTAEEDGAGIDASVIGGGSVEITTGDISVTATGEGAEATGIILVLSDPEDPEEESGIEIVADGDVTAEDTGLLVTFETSDEAAEQTNTATADVLITGTLTAEQAVVVDEYVTEDNLSLTVWKIETPEVTAVSVGEDGTVVNEYNTPSVGTSAADSSNTLVSGSSAEANAFTDASIQYIIKVEAPDASQGELRAADANGNALSQSHGYDVAKEGETVTLKISVKDGYELTGAFNGEGEDRVEIKKDENGNYYITVPKGGGVYLSVTLKAKETETPQPNPDPEPQPLPAPQLQPAPQPQPEPRTLKQLISLPESEPQEIKDIKASLLKAYMSGGNTPVMDSTKLLLYADGRFTIVVKDINGGWTNSFEGYFRNIDGILTIVLLDGRTFPIKNNKTFMIGLADGYTLTLTLESDLIQELMKGNFTGVSGSPSAAAPATDAQPGTAAPSTAAASTSGVPDTSIAAAQDAGSSEREGQIIDWARKNGIIP